MITSLGGMVGGRTMLQVASADAKEILVANEFQQTLDFTGLDPGTYQVRLNSYFFVPTDEPNSRRGLRFRKTIPIAWPGRTKPGNSPVSAGDVAEDAIHWGDSVQGLQAGIHWTDNIPDGGSTLTYGITAGADLYLHNTTSAAVGCTVFLPHSMDGWASTIEDSSGLPLRRNQVIFTAFEPQRSVSLEISPGQTVRITGNNRKSPALANSDDSSAQVDPVRFRTAATTPHDAEHRPPYTFGFSEGQYTLQAHLRVRLTSAPSANLIMTTGALPFEIRSSPPAPKDPRNSPPEESVHETADQASNTAANAKLPWRAFGRVTDPEGNPLPDVTVRAATGRGTLLGRATTTTDQDGRYDFRFGMGIRFSDANSGDQPHPQTQVAQITASRPGFFEQNFCRHGDGLGSLRPVPSKDLRLQQLTTEQVVLPDRPREVNFVMLPAAAVSGTLVDENGSPLHEFSVSLTGDNLPPGSSVLAQGKTDAEGRFTLSEIPTTTPYQFVVRKPRHQLASPWLDSWASGPLTFLPPGQSDFTAVVRGDDVSVSQLAAQHLQLRIEGPGVDEKEAVKQAGRQKQETLPGASVVSDAGPSSGRIEWETLQLTLKNRGPAANP